MSSLRMTGQVKLNAIPALAAAVARCFAAGQAEGAFPKDRDAPTGGERVVWIGIDSTPEAFATFFDAGHGRVWLDLIYVRPQYRRRGHAHKLVVAVRAWARANGFHRVVFGTDRDNKGMRQLAEVTGFREMSDVYYDVALTEAEG